MRDFELSIEEELKIYIDSNLTPTELFILRLLFLSIDGENKYLVNYISNVENGRSVLRAVLESLLNKKVINSTFVLPKEGEALDVKNIPFNKNFLKKYIRNANEIGKEFFDAYPPFITIGGRLCSIRNFTKANLISFDEFCIFYAKSIKSCGVTHERVMDAVEYAKDNNLIHYSIIEFIASKKYLEIEYIRDSGNVNGYSNFELL